MTSQEAYMVLNMIAGVGPVRVRALLERFGSPQAILSAALPELMAVEGIGAEVARNLAGWRQTVRLDEELARVREAGVRVVCRDDADYPANLRQIYDPPLVLYVRGTLRAPDKLAIGVVGSRRATLYGREMARKLSFQLARCGVTVVSGLARGVDTAAHTGALQAKGRTVAVLGCGLAQVYPPENEKLAAEIVAAGGAVVSELPMTVAPDRQNFPVRNRIISGWSLGVVVVEAHLQSGALITARQAAEQGREVFAVPGRADSIPSRGPNRLIKDGAKLTEDAEDILAEFEWLIPRRAREPAPDDAERPQVELTEQEQKVLAAIQDDETAVDDIIRASGLTSACVSATLLALEMKRVVRQLPGNRYARP